MLLSDWRSAGKTFDYNGLGTLGTTSPKAPLWPQMLAMAVLGTTLLTISVLRFRKSLD